MVKEIVKDLEILTKRSDRVNFKESGPIIVDLLDTANANSERCSGLAAIQIGVPKRIIVVKMGKGQFRPFVNPVIIWKGNKTYQATEGCLSLEGERTVTRYRQIRVAHETTSGKLKVENFDGYLAEVIQHEVDHLNGILI